MAVYPVPSSPAGWLVDQACGEWAHNSAVECHLHTVEVQGSSPCAPTIKSFKHSNLANR
jgi:hypothetical protein